MAFRFPPRCLAAQLAGQSICGILAALVQIVALVVPSVTGTASLYYAIAVGVMGSTLAAYVTVWYKVEDFRRTVNKKQEDEEARSNTGWKIDFGMLKRVLRKLSLLLISLILSVMVSVILNPGVTALIESSGKGTNAWSGEYPISIRYSL